MTSVVVTAFGDQLEAFASDLGNNHAVPLFVANYGNLGLLL